jgi:tetratricopeptide (TPR) repeat protein
MVFWLDASSAGTITQGLKGICNLPEALPCALDGSPESALLWIGSLKDNYAMVFDNADVLTPAELEAYFPPGQRGNILITSRNFTMQHLTLPENSLEVMEMEENDAIGLLLKASCLNPFRVDLQVEASKIVKELFCFPLAIDQAGAYIASGATSIKGYLEKYSKHKKTLLSHAGFTGASRYGRTVYQTWELSYMEIQERAQSDGSQRVDAAKTALLLLGLFPFFHHQGITEEIFAYAAAKDGKTLESELSLASPVLCKLLSLNEADSWDNFIFREGLQVLMSFSLIKQGPPNGVYNMHPLVHAWSRDRMTLSEKQTYSSMACGTLSRSLNHGRRQRYEFRRVLASHVRANLGMIEKDQTTINYLDDAYSKFGLLLQEQGYLSEAKKLQFQVLELRNRVLGVKHPDTIWAMANLAVTYRKLGEYTEAEKLETQVVNARNRIFKAEHSDTIRAMANLAVTYRKLEKYTKAEKLEIQVLDARNRKLGVEHPDTIWAMANLAVTYRNAGKYTEAEKLEIQVLDARNRILGAQHSHTIGAMVNLAATYRNLEKYTEAEKLEIQVLDVRNRKLGVEHPDTIWAMANLAVTYRNAGKYTKAEKLEIQVLDARNRILGEEHLHTIWAMENLAATYQNIGKYREAEKLQIQVLDSRNQMFGVEHPDTILAKENLAETYRHLGKHTEAEKLEIHVLDKVNPISSSLSKGRAQLFNL